MVSPSHSVKQPLSNVQLELLRVFARQVSDNDLSDLRQMIAEFFAHRAVVAADVAWDKNGWSETDVQRLLNTKLRSKRKISK